MSCVLCAPNYKAKSPFTCPSCNLLLSPRLGHCIYENRQSVAKYFSDFLDPNLHGKELQSVIPI